MKYYLGVYKLKRNHLMLLCIMMILAMGTLAQAAVEITSGLTGDKISLDVDYIALRGEDKNLTLSPLSLTFENKGNTSEDVILSFSGVAAGYVLNLSETSFTLDALGGNNTAKTISLNAVVPADKNSGTHEIGKLMVGSAEYTIQTSVEPMLVIESIIAYANGDKMSTISSSGGKIKDIRPGSKVELKFRIKNKFNKGYDNGDIDDAELRVEFSDYSYEDDFDNDIYEEEEFDISAGVRDDSVTISFDVPVRAKKGSYELLVTLEGEDDSGAKHFTEWMLILAVDRVRDDVQLETATLSTNLLKCTRTTLLKLKLTNFGSNNQDNAAISVYNAALGINHNLMGIELDKDPQDYDNSFSKTITLNIDDEADAGDYYFDVYAYVDGDKEVDHKVLKLTLEDCKPAVPVENKSTEEVVVVTSPPADSNGGQQQTVPFIETTESSFSESKGLIVLMSVAVVLLIVFIILLIWLLVKGR